MLRMLPAALTLAIMAPLPVLAQGAELRHGTIAVLPFGTAYAGDRLALATAQVIGDNVQQVLVEDRYFVGVMGRDALQEERRQILEDATEPWTLESLVRLNTESGLNANYLLAGWVEQHEVRRAEGDNSENYTAQARVRVRVLNVETGATVLDGTFETDNSVLANASIPGAGSRNPFARVLTDVVRGAATVDDTPEEALDRLRTNSSGRARDFFASELGYVFVDYELAADSVSEIMLVATRGLGRGTRLELSTLRAGNRDPNNLRRVALGEAVVTRVDDDYAYATIETNYPAVAEAVRDPGATILVHRK